MNSDSNFYDSSVGSRLLCSIFHSAAIDAEIVHSEVNCASVLLLNSDYEVKD